MKRGIFFLAISISLLSVHLGAQSTSTDTFVVKQVVSKITVAPEKYFLYLNEDNWFKIKYSGKNKMGRIEFRGGTVSKKDSLYDFKTTTGVSGILVVYEKMKDGSEKQLYTWTYKLFSREIPVVTLDGTPNDSFADKMTTIALGKLRAKQRYGNDYYQVVSFTMYFRNGNKLDTLKSTSGEMTLDMKQHVDKIDVKNKGGVLIFDDIKAIGPGGKEIDLPPLRIYLQDGDRKMQIGL
ncbi:MAG: hypothetical protein HY064_02420 [Bacteroidetes bacterium]|nr:hypothetical protein [Bacteroidota bacterium]